MSLFSHNSVDFQHLDLDDVAFLEHVADFLDAVAPYVLVAPCVLDDQKKDWI